MTSYAGSATYLPVPVAPLPAMGRIADKRRVGLAKCKVSRSSANVTGKDACGRRLHCLPQTEQRSTRKGWMMDARIDVITLAVADLDRALAFYRDGLGLQTEGVMGTEWVEDD